MLAKTEPYPGRVNTHMTGMFKSHHWQQRTITKNTLAIWIWGPKYKKYISGTMYPKRNTKKE